MIDLRGLVTLQQRCDPSSSTARWPSTPSTSCSATRQPAAYHLADIAPSIGLGVSPRATLGLVRGARALALIRGRTYATPQDVFDIAPEVLRHRLLLTYDALARDIAVDDLINRILATVPATWVSPKPNESTSQTRAGRLAMNGQVTLLQQAGSPDPSTGRTDRRPTAVVELVRGLEITIGRRVDGSLHGNYQGITPGHGSEPGESRVYQPGDDVRRIDWNVTARTQETHVRDQIADRDLEAWLVVDASAAMRFGTITVDKAQIALAAAACVGFLTVRNKNRIGAVLVAGPHLKVMPPRAGRDQVRAILTNIALAAARASTSAAATSAGAIDRVARLEQAAGLRLGRSPTSPSRDGHQWIDALTRLGLAPRHPGDPDPRPARARRPADRHRHGVDPATGRTREVRVTADVQRRFAEAAAAIAQRTATTRSAAPAPT